MLCDADPALEKQRAITPLKAPKTFSLRITHPHAHTQVPKPTASSINMIKHSDQTTANLSFINVTADVVAEKGLPVPLTRQGMQHVATLLLVAATPSIKHWVERESTARQSRQGHKNTSGEIKILMPALFQVSALPVQLSVQTSINRITLICSLPSRSRLDTGPDVSFSSWCWQCECQKQKGENTLRVTPPETSNRSYNSAIGKKWA